MTDAELAEIRARANAATKGPWRWRYCVGGVPELVRPVRGILLVMDAVRNGMCGAVLRFAKRTSDDAGGIMFKAQRFFQEPGKHIPDYQEPSNPDMAFIAHARTDIPALLDEVERLRAALDGVRKHGLPGPLCSTECLSRCPACKAQAAMLAALNPPQEAAR